MPSTPPPSPLDFVQTLQRWPRLAEQYWYDDPRRPGLGCFGTGYNSWGVQTNQKFIGAYAVLATDPRTDPQEAGCSREALLQRALSALRFSLASHVSGDHSCTDGTQWGHTWISGLGIERMMHGVAALAGELTEEDQAGLERMLCSEADWLLELPTEGTPWARDGGNKPESNIWNGAICARAALTYPYHRQAGAWLQKARSNLFNGISIAADAQDDTLVAGRPLREWHVGANFFPHYALDHHGYLNVGYMVICLSNIAMLHYGLRLAGLEPPEALYHHCADLWQVVKQFIFEDGRLARLGGDTRQRYCYCQDYLLPALVFCGNYLADPGAAALETGCLRLIQTEQAANSDGSFTGERLATIRQTNPYYYTRLESDKAAVLSMNAYWRRAGVQPCAEPPTPPARGVTWQEPEHGAILHRSPRRLASWSWRAGEPPQGLCLPPTSGHLAEWCENLGGRVLAAGEQGRRTVLQHWQQAFPGGFVTAGAMTDSSKRVFPEGWTCSEPLVHKLAVAALPDDRTMVVLEHCRVPHRTYLCAVKGLKLNVPNDLFNGRQRRYAGERGELLLAGTGEGQHDGLGHWLNVEGCLGVVGLYGGEELAIWQAGQRRASGYADSLYYDEICFPCRVGLWDAPPETVLLDCGSLVLSGADAAETAAVAATAAAVPTGHPDLRAVRVPLAGGGECLVVANFGEATARTEAAGAVLEVAAGQAALVRLD